MTGYELADTARKIATEYKTLYVKGCFGAPLTAANKRRYLAYAYNERRQSMIFAATPDTFGFDCVCLIKGILWGWNGNKNATYGGARYCYNRIPDIGEDVMITRCTEKSRDFERVPVGAMLWMSGHCGIYVGDGLAAEATPKWKNGVQLTAVGNIRQKDGYDCRTWTMWGKLPWVEYKEAEEVTQEQFDAMMDDWLKRRAALKISNYAQEAVAWGVANGLLSGDENGNMMPQSFVKRQDLMLILKRLCEKITKV